jgi:hypothetical protein
MPRATRALFALTLLIGIPCSTSSAGACDPPRYQILGKVVDPGGRPLVDATVRLLLDRISAQEFASQGPRARLRRTNSSGTYLALIDCDEARGITDAPNPCAKKPKHLTVAVETEGYRTRLVVFKLRDLDVNKDAGGCLVQVPDIRLSR